MRSAVLLFIGLMVTTPTAALRADEAPHARAYLRALNLRLEGIRSQMPTISRAADLAAEAIVSGRGDGGIRGGRGIGGERGFGVRGDAGLANELSNRTGAMMGYDGRAGEAGDVILFVFGLARSEGPGERALLAGQLDRAARLKAAGSVVIGIGSAAQLDRFGMLDELGGACTVFLDNRAGGTAPLNRKRRLGAGLELSGGGADGHGLQGVPMAAVLNAAVAWAFECELFSAITRLDKVPVVRQSFEIDTRRRRWLRYGSQRFHHDRWLDPIPPGDLGLAYLDGLRDVLRDVGTASWRGIARASRRAESTLTSGGTVWLRAGGRYLPYHVDGQLASDPGLFTALNHDGSDPRLAGPGGGDFVIAVGESETAGSYEWGEPELLRKAGRGVAWVVNGYNTQPRDLYQREVLIDLWAPFGDGVVRVENYDTRLGPVTGVVGEAVTWMIAAEVVGERIERDQTHRRE
jgi:hypothetical protein